jgi:hypothetical protein
MGRFRYDAKQDALRARDKPMEGRFAGSAVLRNFFDGGELSSGDYAMGKAAVPFTVEVPNRDTLVRSKVEAMVAVINRLAGTASRGYCIQ